ncbi:HD domain-containing phosphohydrolase [Alkaliphilus pronyensis]|nr:HD domain-containing phosphohydrolase [Alkaliphilus pronyensis]
MNSLRGIITVILVIVLIILISVSLLNFFYVNSVYNDLEDLYKAIILSQNIHNDINLPLKVINNIENQTSSNQPMDSDRYDRLLEAYLSNYSKLTEKTDALLTTTSVLEEMLEDFNSRIILNGTNEFRILSKDINSVLNNTDYFILSFNSMPKSEIVNIYRLDSSAIRKTALNYDKLKVEIDSSLDSFRSLQRSLITKYISIVFLSFMITLAIIIVLTAVLIKLLRTDIPFVVKSFNMLYAHDYDINNLPKIHGIFKEEIQVKKFVEGVFQEQKIIDEIKQISSSEFMLEDVIDNIFKIIHKPLKTDRIGVAFINYPQEKIIAEHGVFKYNRVLLGPGFEVSLKDTTLTDLIKENRPIITHDIDQQLIKRPDSKSLQLLRDEGIKSNMIIPITTNKTVVGFIFFSSIKENNYDEKALRLGKNIAYELSSIINKTYLTKLMFTNVTKTFADIVEKKDYETGDHIKRMTAYSKIIASKLINHPHKDYSIKQSFINDVENYAAVHDIGKVAIPDCILKKPGKLTSEEWDIMKAHSTIGADLLVGLKDSLQIFNKNFFEMAITITRYHHERWDGSGYPEGLSGVSIPLAARIVAIADVFDALSSKRIYKEPLSFKDSVKQINIGSGSHFDPELIKIFNASIGSIREVYEDLN